ncbi:MAG TPA: ribose ABC transporter permease [Lachnospiraceae bacterium]|nr:ribose ABC transporter permease [Lachnospiraceae bacterium]
MKESKINQNLRQYAISGVLVILVLFFGITQKSFLRLDNIMNVLRQISVTGIVAVGSTFVLLSGGLDLSVGSLLAVTGTLTASLMVNYQVAPLPAAFIGILASVLLGTCNGLLVQFLGLPPMIATLGMMTSARGAAYLISGGLPIYDLPEPLKFLGKGTAFGVVPVPVIIMLVCFALGWIVLETTYFGTNFYALGGNPEAARLAGIPTALYRVMTYVLSGLACGIGGIVLLYRVNSGQPAAAVGMEMQVITGCVLGGVSLSGGEGKISCVLIGCLVVGLLSNGLTIMQVNEYWQQVFTGLVLILAVCIDRLTKMQHVKRVKK